MQPNSSSANVADDSHNVPLSNSADSSKQNSCNTSAQAVQTIIPEVVLTASEVNSSQDSATAWIIGEAEGMNACRQALTLKGIHVVKSYVLSELKCPKLRSNILTQTRNKPPKWLWLNVTNDVYKWGGDDGKRLAIFLAALIRMQLDNHNQLVLQGAITNTRGWHTERF